jgi:phosphoribosyl 1,2-cyclic phosphodiesterase
MRVRFWGTRGSIAAPGPDTVRYGGNTSCVEVVTRSGNHFVLDCGTGARPLGLEMAENASGPIRTTILLTHTHWDHIQGFPFFQPLFEKGSEITVYAPLGVGRSLTDVLAGQMEFTYFPVELGQLPANIDYKDLVEGEYEVNGARVVSQYLNHPTMTLGYRIEADGVVVCYMCDHEPYANTLWHAESEPGLMDSILHLQDRKHAEFMVGADLVIHDSQYTPDEYPRKKGWGHSTYEYVVEMASAAGAKRVILTHHEPTHTDDELDRIQVKAQELASMRGRGLEVSAASEGWCTEIVPQATAVGAAK